MENRDLCSVIELVGEKCQRHIEGYFARGVYPGRGEVVVEGEGRRLDADIGAIRIPTEDDGVYESGEVQNGEYRGTANYAFFV